MSLVKKNWHQDVMAALELAREEVQKADKQIRKAGAEEMATGDKDVARDALSYSDKLDDFLFELDKVGDKWQAIQEVIDGDKQEVQEVVLPTKVRGAKGGYTRKVTEMAPWTNFTARINDGELIKEPTAKAAFAKAMACFDLSKIAKLGVMLNGEPLVSQSKSDFKKYPQSVVSIKDGWYASTYCSTATKVRFIQDFAKKFNIKAEVQIVPHRIKHGGETKPVMMPKSAKPGSPKSLTDGRVVKGVPFKVSEVVCACFPEVFKRGLVTQNEVDFLLTKEASRQFKTGGNEVLRRNRGKDEDRIVVSPKGSRKARFYPTSRVSISFGGKNYYLSCEFSPAALTPVVAWLEGKGFTKAAIAQMVEKVAK